MWGWLKMQGQEKPRSLVFWAKTCLCVLQKTRPGAQTSVGLVNMSADKVKKQWSEPGGGHWVSIYCLDWSRGNLRPELWNLTENSYNRRQHGKIQDNTDNTRQGHTRQDKTIYMVVVVTFKTWTLKPWASCDSCRLENRLNGHQGGWKIATKTHCDWIKYKIFCNS